MPFPHQYTPLVFRGVAVATADRSSFHLQTHLHPHILEKP